MEYVKYPTHVQRGDGLAIPLHMDNRDYVAFLAWEEAGNTAAEPPEPTHAQLWERAIAEMRSLRQPILEVLDGLQSSALTLVDVERAQVIETAKQGLRDITKLDLSDCTTYEEMRAAVGSAYYALVATLPADIKAAFKEATQ